MSDREAPSVRVTESAHTNGTVDEMQFGDNLSPDAYLARKCGGPTSAEHALWETVHDIYQHMLHMSRAGNPACFEFARKLITVCLRNPKLLAQVEKDWGVIEACAACRMRAAYKRKAGYKGKETLTCCFFHPTALEEHTLKMLKALQADGCVHEDLDEQMLWQVFPFLNLE